MRTEVDQSAPEKKGADLDAYLSRLHASWLTESVDRPWRTFDGTLVFADVSGFTPLAERLARKGKVGAEELTDILNTVFRDLLGVAHRFGGDCLKFGGDALMILFSGEGHAQRGAAGAQGMLAALRALRRARINGIAKLDMSVGVHTGEVHAYLVGLSHRELIVTGPAVTTTLALESAATAGQILLSPQTAEAVAGEVEPCGDAFALCRMVTPSCLEPAGGLIGPDGLDPAAGLPVGVASFLARSHVEGEHRLATIGFIEFGGTDQLLADTGPQSLGVVLDDLVRAVQTACEDQAVTFLGTDVDRDGGKILLAAGAPSAAPDDEDRMLHAIRMILDSQSAVPVRAGVNRGRIFAVDLGSTERRAYTVMGDTVNLAARVMGKASWGQLIATQDVIDRARTDFELTALDPFMVKGKSAPVRGQTVGHPRGARVLYDEASLKIVGRNREIALMREAVVSAHQGEGRAIELVGPPGIGKSKLMSTVLSMDHGLAEFTVEAGRYSLATPYFALRRSLRRIVGAPPEASAEDVEKAVRRTIEWMAPELTEWLPLLAGPLGIDMPETRQTSRLDPVNRPQMVHATVTSLIERVMTGPSLITVEDAHWLDEASSEVVRHLALGLLRKPWVVLVTRRDEPGGLQLPDEASATRIELNPLVGDAAMAMAWETASGLALPPGTIDELVQRSGGNPLFLQELVKAAATGRLSELPETIEATVAATIDTLAPDDRSLLRHASVLGSKFPIGVLGSMLEVPPETLSADLDRLDHFLNRETAGDVVRFRHVLLRDVAYEGLSFRTRRALHERAGVILEDSAGDHPEHLAELLSIHFHAAGRYRQSWTYSRIAGERARRNGAPVEAAAFLARALEDSRHIDVGVSDRAEAAVQLGDIYELGGRYEDADTAYRLARRLGKEPLQLAEVSQKIGLLREREGRFTAAIRWFGRGLKALGDDMSEEANCTRAVLVGTAGHSRVRQGRYVEAIQMLEEAARLAESSGELFALAYAYQQLDLAHSELGKLSNCVYSQRALAIYEELGNERGKGEALNQMGITAYWEGRWDDAVNLYERSLVAQRRAGSLVDDAVGLNNIGEIRSDQGRIREAEQLLTAALQVWTGAGLRHGIGWATSNLARAAARDGRLDEAEERFIEAQHILSGVGAEGMLLETMARQVELAVFRGDHSTGIDLAREVGFRATKLGGMANVLTIIHRMKSYALCQSGDFRSGWTRLIENLADCRERGADYDAALALEALARIAPHVGEQGSEDFAAEAKAILDRLGVIATPDVPLPN